MQSDVSHKRAGVLYLCEKDFERCNACLIKYKDGMPTSDKHADLCWPLPCESPKSFYSQAVTRPALEALGFPTGPRPNYKRVNLQTLQQRSGFHASTWEQYKFVTDQYQPKEMQRQTTRTLCRMIILAR